MEMNKDLSTINLNNIPDELKEQYKQDSADNLKYVQDAFYRVSLQGGRYKVNGKLIGNDGTEFVAIIIKEIPVNVWYKSKYNPLLPNPPECWSLGGIHPLASSTEKQSKSCIDCKWNKFGSNIIKDPQSISRKGKACKNSRRLVLKVINIDLPVLFSLPPSSIKLLNAYLKELSGGSIPLPVFAVETKFAFDYTVEYPRPLLSIHRILDLPGEYINIKKYRDSQAVENALNAYAMGEEVSEEELKDAEVSSPEVF